MTRNVPRLISLFKSAAEIARIAGIHRTAVGRWSQYDWKISVPIQIKLLRAARERGLDIEEVAHNLGVESCECCGAPIDAEIREIMGWKRRARAAA